MTPLPLPFICLWNFRLPKYFNSLGLINWTILWDWYLLVAREREFWRTSTARSRFWCCCQGAGIFLLIVCEFWCLFSCYFFKSLRVLVIFSILWPPVIFTSRCNFNNGRPSGIVAAKKNQLFCVFLVRWVLLFFFSVIS